MIVGVYCVRDELVSFMSPFTERSDEAAIRGFGQACNNPDLLYAHQSDDFTLYKIGDFDDAAGVITPIVPPTMLCRGDDVVSK